MLDLESLVEEPVSDEQVDVVHCCSQLTHVDLLRTVPFPRPGAIKAVDEAANKVPTPNDRFAAIDDCGEMFVGVVLERILQVPHTVPGGVNHNDERARTEMTNGGALFGTEHGHGAKCYI